jgi:hypothetical protein
LNAQIKSIFVSILCFFIGREMLPVDAIFSGFVNHHHDHRTELDGIDINSILGGQCLACMLHEPHKNGASNFLPHAIWPWQADGIMKWDLYL